MLGLAPPAAVSPAPVTPESKPAPRPLRGLDFEGLLQALAGTVIALIALFSSYDHINVAGRRFPLQQQWGVWLIAASLALVLIDAELATRSRLRAAHERARDQDSANEERNRAAEARDRAAEAAERQGQAAARQHRCALLSGRLQLDPSPINRERFGLFLNLMAEFPPEADLG
jgi:hypothetical protein